MIRQTLLIGSLVFALVACGDRPAGDESAAVEEDTSVTEAATHTEPGLPRTDSVAGASVFFITPTDGATVANPVSIEFGIEGMTVVKAGDDQPASGHHHLLIDTDLPDLLLPIPADAQHIHFGDGSTATEITLEPGEHQLQLLLGDHLHIPHDPPVVSDRITITVE